MNPFTLLSASRSWRSAESSSSGEVLHDHAEQQLHDPASVRRQLEQAEQAHAAGEISEEDLARIQAQAVDSLLPSPANRVNPATGTQ